MIHTLQKAVLIFFIIWVWIYRYLVLDSSLRVFKLPAGKGANSWLPYGPLVKQKLVLHLDLSWNRQRLGDKARKKVTREIKTVHALRLMPFTSMDTKIFIRIRT
jgi:hypothetical protein